MKNGIILLAFILLISCNDKKDNTKIQKKMENNKVIDYKKLGMDKDNLPKGLHVGDKIPNLTINMEGKEMPFSNLYKNQKVVILFYRGYWCPFCSKFLEEFSKRAKEIEDKGVKLIAITPEKQEIIEKTKESISTLADFTIISDENGAIQKAFDVQFTASEEYVDFVIEKLDVNIKEETADGSAKLPVPASFVIDKTGTIIYRHFDPDYKKRIKIDEILNVLN